jgi:DNA mismatch repair protein MutL
VHQQNAHERILFDSYQAAELSGNNIASQQSMFPVTVDFASADAVIMNELLPELLTLGYQIEPFGNNTFVIQSVPASVKEGSEKAILEKMLDQYKHFSSDIKCSAREKVWRSLASQQSIKGGIKLGIAEMQELISKLFSSSTSNATPSGRPVYLSFHYDELSSLFGR